MRHLLQILLPSGPLTLEFGTPADRDAIHAVVAQHRRTPGKFHAVQSHVSFAFEGMRYDLNSAQIGGTIVWDEDEQAAPEPQPADEAPADACIPGAPVPPVDQ